MVYITTTVLVLPQALTATSVRQASLGLVPIWPFMCCWNTCSARFTINSGAQALRENCYCCLDLLLCGCMFQYCCLIPLFLLHRVEISGILTLKYHYRLRHMSFCWQLLHNVDSWHRLGYSCLLDSVCGNLRQFSCYYSCQLLFDHRMWVRAIWWIGFGEQWVLGYKSTCGGTPKFSWVNLCDSTAASVARVITVTVLNSMLVAIWWTVSKLIDVAAVIMKFMPMEIAFMQVILKLLKIGSVYWLLTCEIVITFKK